MFLDTIAEKSTDASKNICNLLQVLITFNRGMLDLLQCFSNKQSCHTFATVIIKGLDLNNRYSKYIFHFCFYIN